MVHMPYSRQACHRWQLLRQRQPTQVTHTHTREGRISHGGAGRCTRGPSPSPSPTRVQPLGRAYHMADTATGTPPTPARATRAERAAYGRLCAAYHEAGHAAAALVVGRRFRYVTIKPDLEDESLGHCQFTHRWPRHLDPATASSERLERYVRKCVICALAGDTAETQFRARHNWVGGSDDWESAMKYAEAVTESTEERDAYVGWLWIRTQQLLARELPAITALAEALLERETIRYAMTSEIVREGWLRATFPVRPQAQAPVVAELD